MAERAAEAQKAAQEATEASDNPLDIIASSRPSERRRGSHRAAPAPKAPEPPQEVTETPQKRLWRRSRQWPQDLAEEWLDEAEDRLRKMPLESLIAVLHPDEAGVNLNPPAIPDQPAPPLVDIAEVIQSPPPIPAEISKFEMRDLRDWQANAAPPGSRSLLDRLISAIGMVARWIKSLSEPRPEIPKIEAAVNRPGEAVATENLAHSTDQENDGDDPAPPSGSGPSL